MNLNSDKFNEDELEALKDAERREFGFDRQTVPPEAEKVLDGLNDENITVENGLEKLAKSCGEYIRQYFTQGLRTAGSVFAILLLCGAVENIASANGSPDSTVTGAAALAGTLAVSAVVLGDMSGLLGSGRDTIETLNIFSKGLLLSLAAASGVVGAPASASAKYVAAMAASDVGVTVINSFITPMLYAYTAAVIADAATGENALDGVASLIRKICTLTLSVFLTIFTAILGISGIISGGADAVTMKTAKLVISNAVPVVGSIISDAAESVVAAARIVRNSAGLLGIFAAAALCIGPFIRLGMRSLLFRAAAAAAQPVAPKQLVQLATKLADAFSIMLGMIGACMLMNMVSIIAFMRLTGAY